jgi:hypothetical protein
MIQRAMCRFLAGSIATRPVPHPAETPISHYPPVSPQHRSVRCRQPIQRGTRPHSPPGASPQPACPAAAPQQHSTATACRTASFRPSRAPRHTLQAKPPTSNPNSTHALPPEKHSGVQCSLSSPETHQRQPCDSIASVTTSTQTIVPISTGILAPSIPINGILFPRFSA